MSVLWFLLEGTHFQNGLGVLEGKQELTKVISWQNVKTTIIANPHSAEDINFLKVFFLTSTENRLWRFTRIAA